MKTLQSNEQVSGNLAAVGAYTLWGVMPIYWRLIEDASPQEVLAHRIVWSFVFMCLVLIGTKKLNNLVTEIKVLLAEKRRLFILIAASVFITCNWYLYIWAVANAHIVQASLGYYINPLISVLFGVLFLKEKLAKVQVVSVVLAFIGVAFLTIQAGVFPWISLLLATSFGLYGLLKKLVRLGAMVGLTVETLITMPFSLLYIFTLQADGGSSFHLSNLSQSLLLMGAGVVTAVPLLLFATGANRISLAMLGFFQYIAPTIMLILGTVFYGEPFNQDHLFAFLLIWVSLLLFTLSRTRWFVRLQNKHVSQSS
ncbi:EamA family transporter RarD [Bacillus tianshenii]|nr:EamA family transporter RarD [Bacillus tianshenii]